jgi:nitric oxide reductase NorD protein
MPLATLVQRAARAVRGGSAPPEAPGVPLDDVRRRLELFLAAMYGRPIPVAAAEPPTAPRPLLRRILGLAPPRRSDDEPGASIDGERIVLPPRLAETGAGPDTFARYQLLAIGQAERLVRGTLSLAPGDDAPLERDLYLLAESAAVDAAIARAAPGVVPALRRARAEALAGRPPLGSLSAPEREVEALVRTLLSADPSAPPPELSAADTPTASLARARELAAQARFAGRGYRGIAAVAAWGGAPGGSFGSLGAGPQKPIQLDAPQGRGDPDSTEMVIAPDGGGDNDPADETSPTDTVGGAAEPGAGAPAPQSDPGQGESDPEDGDEDAEARGGGAESPADADAAPRTPKRPGAAKRDAFEYPEWDWKTQKYVERASTVRIAEPLVADGAWAAEVLRAHAAVARRLREKFERLRARRVRLTRQREGDELDLAACVDALVDRRTGHALDDRLYLQVRPARRGLAIAILVDISGSTDERVGASRIIDLEKVALLLTCEALDALGDEYGVLTFSGKGADDVRLRTIKDFGERTGETVRQRITALRPEGYTRLGPAVRHASALLARPGSGHRLLLILSDGRPNDVDQYNGRYGIEDSRQAVAEARQQGIFPFCLTVDRKGPAYISRIFGQSGHVILRHADQLPLALSQAVRQLLGS